MSIELIDEIVGTYEQQLKQKGYLNLPGSNEKSNVASNLRSIIVNHFDYPEPLLPGESSKSKFQIQTAGFFGKDAVTFSFNFVFDCLTPYNYLTLQSIQVSVNNFQPFNIEISAKSELPDAEQAYQIAKIRNNYHVGMKRTTTHQARTKTSNGRIPFGKQSDELRSIAKRLLDKSANDIGKLFKRKRRI